jgi:hypothetical protein
MTLKVDWNRDTVVVTLSGQVKSEEETKRSPYHGRGGGRNESNRRGTEGRSRVSKNRWKDCWEPLGPSVAWKMRFKSSVGDNEVYAVNRGRPKRNVGCKGSKGDKCRFRSTVITALR